MSAEEISAYVESRIDQPYLRRTAKQIAASVRGLGEPLEVCFQPGDGSRYDLVIVPVLCLRTAAPRVAPIRSIDPDTPVPWDAQCAFGVSREPGKAVVAWVGDQHAAVALDLVGGGFVGDYLAEKYNCTRASGALLAALFNAVGEELRG